MAIQNTTPNISAKDIQSLDYSKLELRVMAFSFMYGASTLTMARLQGRYPPIYPSDTVNWVGAKTGRKPRSPEYARVSIRRSYGV